MDVVICEPERSNDVRTSAVAAAPFINQVMRHPFLVRCRDGSITMAELERFLAQHSKYASYFTRYLCAVMSELGEAADVLRLAENLAEELGYGDGDGVPHSRIYAELLADFGLRVDDEAILPETQNLIDVMFMLCRQPGGLAGLGALCLGAEAIVPTVYSSIIDGFVSHGVRLERLRFFTIHVDCDDGHAETMRVIIDRKTRESRASGLAIVNAAEIAINARLRFFDALSRGRQ
jgi:pyrroloquinoline-quinone synthase